MGDDIKVSIGAVDRTKAGTSSAKKRLLSLSKALAGAGAAALAGAMKKVVEVGSNYEEAINTVGVLSNATAAEVEALSTKARELGATTQFTATETADAMQEFARAGFSAAQTTKAIDGALELTAATGAEMAQSTSIMASTVKQFGLEARDTAKLADVYTFAINNSKLNMTSLTEAMKFAGTAGASFGMSVEETTAAVAAFADLGLEGSLAGSNFRMAMIQAAKATDKKTAVLKKYGLTMEDINPATHNFSEILQTVGEAGLTSADSIEIFGARAGTNIAALAAQVRDGTVDIDKFTEKLEKSAGTAAESSRKMLDTVKGDWTKLMSAIEERALQTFDKMKPTLRQIIQAWNLIVSEPAAAFGLAEPKALQESRKEMEKLERANARVNEMKNLIRATEQDLERIAEKQFYWEDQIAQLEKQRSFMGGLNWTKEKEKQLAIAKQNLQVQDELYKSSEYNIQNLENGIDAVIGGIEEQNRLAQETKKESLTPSSTPNVESPDGKTGGGTGGATEALKNMREEAAKTEQRLAITRDAFLDLTNVFDERTARSMADRIAAVEVQYQEILSNTELSETARVALVEEREAKISEVIDRELEKQTQAQIRANDKAVKEAERAAREKKSGTERALREQTATLKASYELQLQDQSLSNESRIALLLAYQSEYNALVQEFAAKGVQTNKATLAKFDSDVNRQMDSVLSSLKSEQEQFAQVGATYMRSVLSGIQSVASAEGPDKMKAVIRTLLTIGATVAGSFGGPVGIIAGAALGGAAQFFHSGGMFRSPGRAHGGAFNLKNDEGLAILQDQEGVLNNTKGMRAAGGPSGLHMMNKFGSAPGGGTVNIQAWDSRSMARFYKEQFLLEERRARELGIGLKGSERF